MPTRIPDHPSTTTWGGRSYARDERGWLAYARFVPEVAELGKLPCEELWPWDGLQVHLDRLPAPDAPLKLLLVHGIGGYGRLVLGPFGLPALGYGCEVVAPDLPGYGLTTAPPARLDFPLWVRCITDLVAAEHLRDGRPVVLFGMSLGGIVAYHAAARSTLQPAGLIATTLLDARDPLVLRGLSRWPVTAALGLPLMRAMPWLFDRIAPPPGLMSRLHAIANVRPLAELCARDPLGGRTRLPLRFYRTMVATEPALEPADFDRCPVLVVHPAEDHMTDIRFTREFVARMRARPSMVELPGCGHFPVEQPGKALMGEALRHFLRTTVSHAPTC